MRSARRTKMVRNSNLIAASCVHAKMAATPALHSVPKSFVHRRALIAATLSSSPSAIDVVANGSARIRIAYWDPTKTSVSVILSMSINH